MINNRKVGPGYRTYIVAEMSANHCQKYELAVSIINAAKNAGADAIKLQTYTADTMTLPVKNDYFKVKGTLWQGRYLYDLYKEAYTPWEWHPKLKKIADEIGIDIFSTPFDETAVDFLEKIDMPVFKIASFELIDIPLIEKIAKKGKPIILSTGMATISEIEEAVKAIRKNGNEQLMLLKCNSAYPAPVEEMNLKTIEHLSKAFNVPVGLSDHTIGSEIAIAAVTLGACMIEKHFTISRDLGGPDALFSANPDEFKNMVESIRRTEKALGCISYEPTIKEIESRRYRRSIFAVSDIEEGNEINENNIRSIRPADGMHPRYMPDIIGYRAVKKIARGTPLSWNMITSK